MNKEYLLNDYGQAEYVVHNQLESTEVKEMEIKNYEVLSAISIGSGNWYDEKELIVFETEEGFGYVYKTAEGYSSWTWWHEYERHFYPGVTKDWFLRYGLDYDLRDLSGL